MTRTKLALQVYIDDLNDKKVLEVACGSTEFSITASEVTAHILCEEELLPYLSDSKFSWQRNLVKPFDIVRIMCN